MDPDDLRDAVRRRVTPAVYARGRRYFLEGRVGPVTASEGVLHAVVHGTEDYDVRLDRDGSRSSCTCPYDGVCKHVVAAALKVASEGVAGSGEPREIEDDIRRARALLDRSGRRAEIEALERRVSGIIASIHADPAERERLLRIGLEAFAGTALEGMFLGEWLRSLEDAISPSAADLLLDLMARDPERALMAIARARLDGPQALALLERLDTPRDPLLADLAVTARIHLLAELGRTDDVAAMLRPSLPVEALEEACRSLREGQGAPRCTDVLERALEERTPRERHALHLLMAELTPDRDRAARHLLACLDIRVDPGVVRRLVEIDPSAAAGSDALRGEGSESVLVEALLEAGEVDLARRIALRSEDPDLIEWTVEETGWVDLAPAERIVDLLAGTGRGDVLWRVRQALDLVRGVEGFDALVGRLRERHGRRPALLRVLDGSRGREEDEVGVRGPDLGH